MDKEILLVTAEMGNGHIRALMPLVGRLSNDILVLGQTEQAPNRVNRIWHFTQSIYEWFSRTSQIPIIGKPIFSILDSLLCIKPIQGNNDLSKPTIQVRLLEKAIKLGICNEIDIEKGNTKAVVTSFYASVAHMANNKTSIPVFCQICDTDLSRAWVPKDPKASNAYYFATCNNVIERLKAYGVATSKISLTGFPLPHKLIGGVDQNIAVKNFEKKLLLLKGDINLSPNNPLRILYALGGASAMSNYGMMAALSLKPFIDEGIVKFTIIPGLNSPIINQLESFRKKYFFQHQNFQIISTISRYDYFDRFADEVANAHILWTKPSELTFYSSLGIPIIMNPPLGSQERANRLWILEHGVGIDQQMLSKSHIWLMQLFNSGKLAQMAEKGWENGIRTATYEVEKIVKKFIESN